MNDHICHQTLYSIAMLNLSNNLKWAKGGFNKQWFAARLPKFLCVFTLSLAVYLYGSPNSDANIVVLPEQHLCLHNSIKEIIGPKSLVVNRCYETIFKTLQKRIPAKYSVHTNEIFLSVMRAAERFIIDPLLIVAIIEKESTFYPEARGHGNSIGLMQIKLPEARRTLQDLSLNEKKLFSIPKNIEAGTAHLAELRARFRNAPNYIAAYGMGSDQFEQKLRSRGYQSLYFQAVKRRYVQINTIAGQVVSVDDQVAEDYAPNRPLFK